MSASARIRPGVSSDALAIAALATQVFLDTYATHGVRPDLAREAFHGYSEQAFAKRLSESHRKFIVAEQGQGLVGFAEVLCSNLSAPVPSISGGELVRLYVQPRAQGTGMGSILIRQAEQLALAASLPSLWLSVWEDNAAALAFYRRRGYAEVGVATYSLAGNAYGNLVFAKRLMAVPSRTQGGTA
jgi:ribosomal protein S18 acetylase RimI-like enzyme